MPLAWHAAKLVVTTKVTWFKNDGVDKKYCCTCRWFFPDAEDMSWVEGNAENLPFSDSSFDAYTIAFGIRNVTDKDVALRDAYRVRGSSLPFPTHTHLHSHPLPPIHPPTSRPHPLTHLPNPRRT